VAVTPGAAVAVAVGVGVGVGVAVAVAVATREMRPGSTPPATAISPAARTTLTCAFRGRQEILTTTCLFRRHYQYSIDYRK
jgi:hypothetical protein